MLNWVLAHLTALQPITTLTSRSAKKKKKSPHFFRGCPTFKMLAIRLDFRWVTYLCGIFFEPGLEPFPVYFATYIEPDLACICSLIWRVFVAWFGVYLYPNLACICSLIWRIFLALFGVYLYPDPWRVFAVLICNLACIYLPPDLACICSLIWRVYICQLIWHIFVAWFGVFIFAA